MAEDSLLSVVSSLGEGSLTHGQLVDHCQSLARVQGSAPPSSVSTQSLKFLTQQCADPQQFVRQFKACSGQKIPQLSGMVDILTKVDTLFILKIIHLNFLRCVRINK